MLKRVMAASFTSAAVLLAATPASGAELVYEYNFAEFGQMPPDGDGEQAVEGVTFDTSGIVTGPTTDPTITTTAFTLSGTADVSAYLDGATGGRLSGLGVCGDVTTNAPFCDPEVDDNITADDVLQLTFSQPVRLQSLEFRNANHHDDFEFPDGRIAEFGIAVGAVPTSVDDFMKFAITGNPFVFDEPLAGREFYIISDATINGPMRSESELYVSGVVASQIPEPAAACLAVVAFAPLLPSRRRTR